MRKLTTTVRTIAPAIAPTIAPTVATAIAILLALACAVPAWAAAPAQPPEVAGHPPAAAAQEHGAGAADGHAGGGGGPFSGDVGNAVWTLAIFGILLWVLGKYAWGPILSGLQDRERFIRDSLESAQKSRDEAVAKLAEYEAKIAKARDEVAAMLAEGRRDAEVLRHREDERARAEAEQTLARARREIDIAKETAIKDLYDRAAHLATAAASRILQRELRPEDHEGLVAEAVAAIERMEAGRGADA